MGGQNKSSGERWEEPNGSKRQGEEGQEGAPSVVGGVWWVCSSRFAVRGGWCLVCWFKRECVDGFVRECKQMMELVMRPMAALVELPTNHRRLRARLSAAGQAPSPPPLPVEDRNAFLTREWNRAKVSGRMLPALFSPVR